MKNQGNDDAGVLVVEDDVLVAFDIERILNDAGLGPIYLAHDLRAGTNLLHTRNIRLAVLDVNIGLDLVFPLAPKAAQKGIPIVFSTGLSSEQMPQEWALHPVVAKPWSSGALRQVLGAWEAAGEYSAALPEFARASTSYAL